MAVAVKLSLADRAFLRKTHRANAAIFMDQRLFLRRVYRAVFFPHVRTPFFRWMLHELSFSAQSTTSQGYFLHRSTSFFRRRAYRAAFFSTSMEGCFSHRMHFESSFSVLINDPFFAESISSHRLFREVRLFLMDQRTFPSGVISL